MRMISKTEFYKIIYNRNLNVHPSPMGRWVDGEGFTTYWKFPDGSLFGISRNCGPDSRPSDFWQVSEKWLKTT